MTKCLCKYCLQFEACIRRLDTYRNHFRKANAKPDIGVPMIFSKIDKSRNRTKNKIKTGAYLLLKVNT